MGEASVFHLERRFVEEIIAHARQEAPREACGLLGGPPGGPVERIYRATNWLQSETRYEIDPRDLLRFLREFDDRGWGDPLGIYHSHPRSEAYPSATDLAQATSPDGTPLYPNTLYFIVSLLDPDRPVLRAFHIVDGSAVEEELAIL